MLGLVHEQPPVGLRPLPLRRRVHRQQLIREMVDSQQRLTRGPRSSDAEGRAPQAVRVYPTGRTEQSERAGSGALRNAEIRSELALGPGSLEQSTETCARDVIAEQYEQPVRRSCHGHSVLSQYGE
jgi:hypothetical protein